MAFFLERLKNHLHKYLRWSLLSTLTGRLVDISLLRDPCNKSSSVYLIIDSLTMAWLCHRSIPPPLNTAERVFDRIRDQLTLPAIACQ